MADDALHGVTSVLEETANLPDLALFNIVRRGRGAR
jgi:hypothetical protein